MAGFFDLSDPDNAAMLGLAAGLLQAGAPSRLPVPLGAALGSGIASGLKAGLEAQRLQSGRVPQQRAGQQATPQQLAPRQTTGGAPAPYPMLLPWWVPPGQRFVNV